MDKPRPNNALLTDAEPHPTKWTAPPNASRALEGRAWPSPIRMLQSIANLHFPLESRFSLSRLASVSY